MRGNRCPEEPPAAEGAWLCPKSDSLIALTIARFTFGAAAQKNFLKLELNITGLDNLKCFFLNWRKVMSDYTGTNVGSEA